MIRCEQVHLTLQGRPLLSDVGLKVVPGRVLALVGPNGAGKSTLLKVLCADHRPGSGKVDVNGRPLHRMAPRERARCLTVLPQHPASAPTLTPTEVVSLGLQLCWGRADDADVHDALAALGVDHLAHHPMGRLSGGERQRVHLARVVGQAAASRDPQAILLDEPISAQDPGHLTVVLNAIRGLARRHAVVVVLHDLHAAGALSHQVCLMARGRIERCGPPDQVLHADLLSRVYEAPFHTLSHPDLQRPVVLPNLSMEEP